MIAAASHTGSSRLAVVAASRIVVAAAADSGTLVVVAYDAPVVQVASCFVADLDTAAAAAAFGCCTYCFVDRSLPAAACRVVAAALAAAADCIGCGTGCIAVVACCCLYFESYSETKDYSYDCSSSDR